MSKLKKPLRFTGVITSGCSGSNSLFKKALGKYRWFNYYWAYKLGTGYEENKQIPINRFLLDPLLNAIARGTAKDPARALPSNLLENLLRPLANTSVDFFLSISSKHIVNDLCLESTEYFSEVGQGWCPPETPLGTALNPSRALPLNLLEDLWSRSTYFSRSSFSVFLAKT